MAADQESKVQTLELLTDGDIMVWSDRRFTRMSKVKKLVLQGQVNAVEFFGVSLENLTDVKIDFLDELRSLVDGNNFHHGFGHQRRVRVLYKGRAIEVTNFL